MADTFDQWCILELFGHVKMAGKVSEQAIGGGSFIRVDVPNPDGTIAFTRFYGPSAIYSIQPVEEKVAVSIAKNLARPPVSLWEMRTLAAPSSHDTSPYDDIEPGDTREF